MKDLWASTAYFALLVAVFIAIGCNGTSSRPKPSISEDKMVRIHADLLIANAAVANLYGPLRDSMVALYQQQVFSINDVKKEEFETNLHIYADDISAMDSIYAKTRVILDSLEGAKQLE